MSLANERAPTAHAAPTRSAPSRSISWNDGIENSPTLSNGVVLLSDTNVRYPEALATSAGSSIRRARSSRYGTSRAKIAPVAGALKIAATPAAAPATSSVRWSLPRNGAGSFRWMSEPIAEPPYSDGPSRPSAPPEPRVVIDAAIRATEMAWPQAVRRIVVGAQVLVGRRR
jgi:hypothetical protein